MKLGILFTEYRLQMSNKKKTNSGITQAATVIYV